MPDQVPPPAAPAAPGAAAPGGAAGGAPPPPAAAAAAAQPAAAAAGKTLLTQQPPANSSGAAPVPAAIELKFPDGFKPDTELVGQYKELARAAGLDNAKAQGLFDLYTGAEVARAQQLQQQAEQQQKDWVEGVKKDKDLGGVHYEATRANAQKAIAQFASPQLRELLDSTGLGDHPELVRAWAAIGKALGEDTAGQTGAGGSPVKGKPSTDERLRKKYPSMYEQKEP